jgi:hypothetical protein
MENFSTDSPELIKMKRELRKRREKECFPIVNRGKLWYNKLSLEQFSELLSWYEKWLDVTDTLVVPEMLPWVNLKIVDEGEVL